MQARVDALSARHAKLSAKIRKTRARPASAWSAALAKMKRQRLALKDEIQRLRRRDTGGNGPQAA
ncbi:MAG: YdcH family protein [Pacificimonas sp.]